MICLKICTRAIKILDLKYKFAETDPNIKVPLNLHGNSHSSPFEDSKYKYDMIKGFLNWNQDLGKCSSSIQIFRDRHENLFST